MKNFDEIYENISETCKEPIEELRKKSRNGIMRTMIIALAIGIILSITISPQLLLPVAIIAIVLDIILSKSRREYVKLFKEKVIRTFVKEYSDTLEYRPNSGIPSIMYNEGEFERRYDRYHTEDLITGTLNGKYKIDMAEVHTENESTDKDGNTTYTTIFHGLFAKVEFKKYVDVNMKIRRNSINLFRKKEKIEMDSSEFEKKFDVHSSNKIIAMQLLTADIMQMLLDFKENNKLTPEITLNGNSLYIRFATGDMFEPNIFKFSLNYNTLKKYYDTINFTLDITEKFVKNIEETEV